MLIFFPTGVLREPWHKVWGPFIVHETFLWGQSELDNLFTSLMPRMVHWDEFFSENFISYFLFFFQIDVRKLNRIRAGAARWSKSRSVHYFYLRLSCLVFLLVFYRGEKKRKIGYKVFVWDGLTKAACSFDQRYPAGYLSSYPPALLSHSPSAQLFSSLPIVSSLAYLISSVTG